MNLTTSMLFLISRISNIKISDKMLKVKYHVLLFLPEHLQSFFVKISLFEIILIPIYIVFLHLYNHIDLICERSD